MTDDIEKILRKAPQPKVSAGLREKLQAAIVLPDCRTTDQRTSVNDWRLVFKRWLPALSFSALLFASLIAIAVQANFLSELRLENGDLRAAGDQVQRDNAISQSPEELRLEQLRKDVAEVERLRQEIAESGAQTEQLAALRAQNQQLKGRLQVAQSQAPAEENIFGKAEEKAKSVQCVSNLKQISLGARMWANDNNGIFPPDFLSMSNELNTPKIMICASDEGRVRASKWTEFGPATTSYEFLAPGISKRESPNTVMVRCPIHGHAGLIDGSVHQGIWKRAVQKNGRWVIER